ncbi:MAG: hypothetical protein RLN88_15930 [Ekhidna sp.]|uniref:hypothetical protein n=1 Tax=Ekhidna sp. TaxID=2608089 RepID=UPI0032EAA2B5
MKKLTIILIFIPFLSSAQWTAWSKMSSGKGETIVTNSIRGYVELAGGKRLEGMVSLKVLNADTIEIRIIPDGEKKKQNYLRAEVVSFAGAKMLQDEKNDYKIPSKNFHPGRIFFENGDEWSGKVAMKAQENFDYQGSKYGPQAVKFANANDEVTEYSARKGNIIYLIQTIDGVENHYIKVDKYFVEVGNPKGRFSYFRNPSPTHVREGATSLAESAVVKVSEDLQKAAAKAAAKSTFEQSMKDGKSMGEAMGNATVAAMQASENVNDVLKTDEILEDETANIYFEEYYIVDNKKLTRSIIYKKNVDEVLNAILEGCGLEEKIVDKAGKMNELTEAMVFLEENICD